MTSRLRRNAVAFEAMEPLDQYILARTAELDAKTSQGV